MFNPKIGGIAAGIGLALSFLVGLAAGAGFPMVLVRALIFAAVFFALASLGYWAIGKYLPELLGKRGGDAPVLGAQVDISVGDEAEDGDPGSDVPEFGESLDKFMENTGDSGENIDPLQVKTLDQINEGGYTDGSLFDIEDKSGKTGLGGDFNVQEMASAIQTILKRENKG